MSKKDSGLHLLRLGPYPSFRAPCRISLSSPPYREPVGGPSQGCAIRNAACSGVAGRHNRQRLSTKTRSPAAHAAGGALSFMDALELTRALVALESPTGSEGP